MSTPDRSALVAASGGLVATVFTTVACVGPLVAIVLGIGGFGWLTRYAYLRVPATVATAVLLGLGFGLAYLKPVDLSCTRAVRNRRWTRALLWTAAAVALAVHVFEYLVIPHLA